ncbi:MAG TPA: hypothetical protein VLJ42_10405 [Solirubrobacteraceae bacterium]|nr:hypothetical protein [Solirubrobacteraceae bacterium]
MGLLGGPVAAGGNCSGWWDCMSAPGASTISSIPNRAGNGDFSGSSNLSTMLGRRTSKGDGSSIIISATLTTSVAASNRPFTWFVGKLDSLTAGTSAYLCLPASNAPGQSCTPGREQLSGSTFTAVIVAADGNDTITTLARDTNPHLFGAGVLSTANGRAEVDGVTYDGTHTGLSTNAIDKMHFHAFPGPINFSTGEVQAAVLSNTEPDANIRRAMRDYFRRKNYGLF